MTWINSFDIGIGNGLRNKLTECLTFGEIERARNLISTAYFIFILLSALIFLLFISFSSKLAWSDILNINQIYNLDLSKSIIIILLASLINFVLTLNNSVAYSNHESAFAGLKDFISNLFFLLGVILLLAVSKKGGLIELSYIYLLSVILSNTILTFNLYMKYKELRPTLMHFSSVSVKPLISLSMQFFVIQIAALIIFTTDNIIIAHFIGPSEVTNYNIIYRLFMPLLLIHTIIITPFWSGFTDSYANRNFVWIKKALKEINKCTFFLTIGIIITAISAKWLLILWIGDNIVYNPTLIMFMAVYVFIMMWNNNFAYFLNGVGELKMQLCTSIIAIIINIPLSIYLTKIIGLGSTGVVLSGIVSLSLFAIIGPLQSFNLLKGKGVIGNEHATSQHSDPSI